MVDIRHPPAQHEGDVPTAAVIVSKPPDRRFRSALRRLPRPARIAAVAAATILLAAAVAGIVVARRDTGEPVATGPETTVTAAPPTTVPAPTTAAPPALALPAPAPTTPSRTAADELAAFFAAAEATDARLREAAVAVNGGIHTDEIVVDPSTRDAVGRANEDVWALDATIPSGLDAALRDAVLLVYSDQIWRAAAMRCWSWTTPGTYPRAGDDGQRLVECLGDGTVPATRYAADLAAARSLAATRPAPAPVAPDSREVAELLVRLRFIEIANAGCDSNGGYRMTEPLTVVWYDVPKDNYGSTLEGHVVGHDARYKEPVDIEFHAGYGPEGRFKLDRGWVVYIIAC